VSVITNISFDHTALLGNTLPKIAVEKAGIIKKNIPVVIGESSPETNSVFKQMAAKADAAIAFADQFYEISYGMRTIDGKQSMNICSNEVVVYPDLNVDLLGIYQRFNVPTVLKTIDILNERGWNLNENSIRRGLAKTIHNTGLMGRWQIIGYNPLTVCDTGHNPAGIKLVVEQISQTAWEKLHIVIGMVNDKDQNEVLSLLPANAQYYFTKATIPRATDPEELAAKADKFGLKGKCYPFVRQALSEALANAGKNDLVFVGGSTFVVAEVL
jgi:dihydrofolate synthase/folylpolyglutamate synthase